MHAFRYLRFSAFDKQMSSSKGKVDRISVVSFAKKLGLVVMKYAKDTKAEVVVSVPAIIRVVAVPSTWSKDKSCGALAIETERRVPNQMPGQRQLTPVFSALIIGSIKSSLSSSIAIRDTTLVLISSKVSRN